MIYALLIYTTGDSDPDEPEMARALAAHREVQREATEAGALLSVARLDFPVRGKGLRKSGPVLDVVDGPFLESKEWLVGFYLVDSDDEDQVRAWGEKIAHPDRGFVEVRPARWHHVPAR